MSEKNLGSPLFFRILVYFLITSLCVCVLRINALGYYLIFRKYRNFGATQNVVGDPFFCTFFLCPLSQYIKKNEACMYTRVYVLFYFTLFFSSLLVDTSFFVCVCKDNIL